MSLNRAYSTLEIKAINEETRTITGIATTMSPDRVGDVVLPEGAVFKLPLPLLWQHNSGKPIGWVTEATPTKKGINIVAQIADDLTDDIKNAWALIKGKLVRGLSIGFRGLDTEQIPNSWGVIFQKWEWLELSAVTIPANADATILSVKQFDVGAPAASGTERRSIDVSPGVSGKSTKPVNLRLKEGNDMKTIAEQITDLEAKRAATAARMQTVMQKSMDEGRSTDEAEQQEFDGLNGEITAIDNDIKRLKDLEKAMAGSARPVAAAAPGATGTEALGTAARVHATVKTGPARAPGIGFARVVKCLGMAHGNTMQAHELAKQLFGSDEEVVGALKAAVVAGSTGNTTWAGNLVGDETKLFADFVEFLRPMTILGKFGAAGVPSLRNVPFRTALIGQTSGGAGYWVGEGKAKPLTKFDFTRTTLEPLKVANIAVLTEEVLRDSSPSAEVMVRDQLAAALRERLDIDFINPAKAAAAGISPASITNGVTPIVSSGDDAAAVREDIKAIFGQFIAANNAPTSGVWIMPSTVALALSLMTNPLGQPEFPAINMNGGTLFGLPVIVSEYVPTVSAGAYVILANAQDIYVADDGGIRIDMSREASLEMKDSTLLQDSLAGTGTSLVSLWQTNTVGFLAERTINWARRRAQAVSVLSGVNWGTAGS